MLHRLELCQLNQEQGRLGAVCSLSGQACLGYISFLQKRGSLDLDGQPACSAARVPAETRWCLWSDRFSKGTVVPKGTRVEDKRNIFRFLPEAGRAGEHLKGVNFMQQSWQGFITKMEWRMFFFPLCFIERLYWESVRTRGLGWEPGLKP